MSFDVAILSSDDSRKYLDFWPFIAYAHRTIFKVPAILGLVTARERCDPLVRELERHGEVRLVRPVSGYPIAAQAKLTRYVVASAEVKRVCYIDDLDQAPIDKEWHLERTGKRQPGSMLFVGEEIYAHEYPGQAPASRMTGEGYLFSNLFRRGQHDDWYEYLASQSTDDRSSVRSDKFSDEALIRLLRLHSCVSETHVKRGYAVDRDTIDRAHWPYDRDRLESGQYISAHMPRPYRQHKEDLDAIFDYIRRRYDGAPLPAPIPEDL